jgi:superoxide dismutase
MMNYQKISDSDVRVGVRQFGGGLLNHNFFFSILKKDVKIDEETNLVKSIQEK